MKYILLILLMIQGMFCHAVICKRISGDTETDNRSVFQIRKDLCGYMWFLTYNGVNRYDGTRLKRYDLNRNTGSTNVCTGAYQLYTDSSKELWLLTDTGDIWTYNRACDRFEEYMNLSTETHGSTTFLCIDAEDNAWFCDEKELYLCHLPTRQIHRMYHDLGSISALLPAGNRQYYLSSDTGLHAFTLSADTLTSLSSELSGGCYKRIYKMLYLPKVHRLVVADSSEGLAIYDCSAKEWLYARKSWRENRISAMKTFKDGKILIATEGIGVHSMDMDTYRIEPFLNAGYGSENSLRSNRIADLYVDENQRIWMADFPDGVSVVKTSEPDEQNWYGHISGNEQSLINDRVNALLKDSEGDIWFATDRGISCYFPRTGRWRHVTSELPCSQFTSLCEISPGEICTGNYMHGLFIIRKNEMKTGNKYADIPFANVLLRKDKDHLWVGTDAGLSLLNMHDATLKPVDFSGYRQVSVYSLYQDKNAELYIGTRGNGLFKMEPGQEYAQKQVSGSIRNVFFILPDKDRLLMGTDRYLYAFLPESQRFDWISSCVNGFFTSGIPQDDGTFMLGTSAGVFRFGKNMHHTLQDSHAGIFLDDFSVLQQPVEVAAKGSPLQTSINYTKVLKLNYDQNTFSFTATTINYDAPEGIVYSWKLNDQAWTTPTRRNIICFSNLSPGEHLVSVRALSLKNGHPISQRNMQVVIRPPLWQSTGALLFYGVLALLLGTLSVRTFLIWEERNLSRDTIKVFINAAKNICMPLTLIKSPLENLHQKYSSEAFKDILQQVKNIDFMFTNLIAIGRISSHPKKLSLLETELTMYLDDTIDQISPAIEQKNIKLHWEGTPGFLRVWIDKEKLAAIIKGVLEIIVNCVNDGEGIRLTTAYSTRSWQMKVEFADNGSLKKKLYSITRYPA